MTERVWGGARKWSGRAYPADHRRVGDGKGKGRDQEVDRSGQKGYFRQSMEGWVGRGGWIREERGAKKYSERAISRLLDITAPRCRRINF